MKKLKHTVVEQYQCTEDSCKASHIGGLFKDLLSDSVYFIQINPQADLYEVTNHVHKGRANEIFSTAKKIDVIYDSTDNKILNTYDKINFSGYLDPICLLIDLD